jgi:hypothetical protein
MAINNDLYPQLGANAINAADRRRDGSWFDAMAEAWAKALDEQANTVVELSKKLEDGGDAPSDVTILAAESQKMGFMSNCGHTAMTSLGSGLETMARKQ